MYPFICWWTRELFLSLATVLYEYWCTNICSSPCFLFFFFDIYLGVELLSHRVVLCFIFEETPNYAPQTPRTVVHSHQQCTGIPISPHPLPQFIYFKNISIHVGVKWYVIFFEFSYGLMILSIFSCAPWPFVHLLWRHVRSNIDTFPILNWVCFFVVDFLEF